MAGEAKYTGPGVREMLDTHTLAKEITERANGPMSQRILDDENMAALHRWVAVSPAQASADPVAKEKTEQMLAEDQEKDGKTAQESGSLIRWLMAKSVSGEEQLSVEEWGLLREWFKENK